MTDQELRALVRESIAKQLGEPAPPARRVLREPSPRVDFGRHPSHAIYLIPTESEAGPCIVEPDVPCTHCNYCKSHGH